MSPPAILTELNRLGIAVTTNGDRLRINAPVGCITDELRTAIFSCKAGLIAILTKPTLDTYADRECQRFLTIAKQTPDGTAWRDFEAMKDPVTLAVVVAGRAENTDLPDQVKKLDELNTELQMFALPQDVGSRGYRIHLAKVRKIAAERRRAGS